MSFKIDPRFPGKVIGTSWNGTPVLVDATPELVNAAKQTELEAASGVRLLRDNATIANFRRAYPEGGSREFYAWCTKHQCTPRHTTTLELQATGGKGFRPGGQPMGADDADEEAMTFRPGMRSHTFHPGSSMAEGTESDPLKREAVPLANPEDDFDEDDSAYDDALDGDVDHLRLPSAASLRTLQRAGLVKRSMSQEQFAARLHRLGMDPQTSIRRVLGASAAGFFRSRGAALPDGTVRLPGRPGGSLPSPNGTTLEERRHQTTVPAGRTVANLQAGAEDPDQVRRALRRTNWDAMTPWRTPAPKGLTLSGRAETRCT